MTKTDREITQDEFIRVRDAILQAALDWTKDRKGKARDVAVFDYCAAAAKTMEINGLLANDCPPWLWVIGVRAGDRVAEIERMLKTSPANLG